MKNDQEELRHWGIKGQKWGIRRFENPDGSLTEEGKKRYGNQYYYENKRMYKAGTISKDEYKRQNRALNKKYADINTIDRLFLGNNLNGREFQRRHEKGYQVFESLIAGIHGAAAGAALNKFANVGKPLNNVIIGAIGGTVIGAGGSFVTKHMNRYALDNVYYKNDNKGR